MSRASFTLPDGFHWDDITSGCYSIRRHLDEIWSSAIDLSKGDDAGFALESNVATINSGVCELLTELHCLEERLKEIRLTEKRSELKVGATP